MHTTLPSLCLFKEGIYKAIWSVFSLPLLFSGCSCFLPSILPLHGWMDEGERERPARWIDEQGAKEVQCIYLLDGWNSYH